MPGTRTLSSGGDMVSAAASVRTTLQFGPDVSADDCPAEPEFHDWVVAAVAGADYVATLPLTVTIRLVTEAEGMMLNTDFRGREQPTNVLAFPAELPPIPVNALEELELGDLVICLNVARDEATSQNKSLRQHLAHLTVHGTLHLLGFDHIEDTAAVAMEALETRVLEGLGLPDPYA